MQNLRYFMPRVYMHNTLLRIIVDNFANPFDPFDLL